MRLAKFYTQPAEPSSTVRRTILDIALILLLVGAMIAIRAEAPSTTYNYAQFWQIRASIDHLNGGSLILAKIDAAGAPARKGPLYAWMLTAAMKLTGLNNDFIYRLPTILAAAGLAVLIYLFGRRWYSRTTGLLAACLWVTAMHMNKMIYLATTDMLLAWWIAFCIFCADRLTFHPAQPRWRRLWAVGLWAGMVLAALTKGWGIVNLAIVGGFVAMAGCLGPGFAALRAVKGVCKVALTVRLLMRRSWALCRAVRLGWGLLAMAAVSVPLWIVMLEIGGQAFRDKVYFEVWQRITGEGSHAPHSATFPGVAHLYYNLLPASIFAGCGLFLVRLQRRVGSIRKIREVLGAWFGRRSPIALPMWWIVTVLIAFGVPAGFRPDYLLPCYPAVALMGAWAAMELSKSDRWSSRGAKHLRRICQAVPFVLAGAIILIPLLYFLQGALPVLAKVLSQSQPERISPGTWYALAALPVVGLAGIAVMVVTRRRRSLAPAVGITCLCMLGVVLMYTHLWNRSARTGDGDVMVQFAEQIKPIVGEDDFIVYNAEKLGSEVYLGRFGRVMKVVPAERIPFLNAAKARWLIVSDIGLLALGAYEADPAGAVKLKIGSRKHRFRPRPQDVGRLARKSVAPIQFESWGTIYLIELQQPIRPKSPPFDTGYISDPAR